MSKMNVMGKVVIVVNDQYEYTREITDKDIFSVRLDDIVEDVCESHCARIVDYNTMEVKAYYKFHRYDYEVTIEARPIFSAREVKRK